MEEGLVPFKRGSKEYKLNEFESEFMEYFSRTHDFEGALKTVPSRQRTLIKGKIKRGGSSELFKAWNDFVTEAPAHPKANKVAILDTLIWCMEKSKEHEDTAGVIKAVTEINKMIKGNLVANEEKTINKTSILGIIDLTKPKDGNDEPITIDVTPQ